MNQALKLEEEITPYLVAVLEKVLSAPEKYAYEYPQFAGHIYAILLLSHFREPTAHDVIVKLFSLPGELPFILFGDTVPEELEFILYATYNDSLDSMKSLASKRGVEPYLRSSALRAMIFAAVDGMVQRSSVVEFFRSLLLSTYQEKDIDMASYIALDACRLYPLELKDELDKGFEMGLIDPTHVSLEEIEEYLEDDEEQLFERGREHLEEYLQKDFYSRIAWWDCISPPRKKKKKKKKRKR